MKVIESDEEVAKFNMRTPAWFYQSDEGALFRANTREECQELAKRWEAHEKLVTLLQAVADPFDWKDDRAPPTALQKKAEALLAELDER